MGRPLKDYTGKKYGRLTVLCIDESKPRGENCSIYWLCKCECGNIVSIRSDKIKGETTLSCGCFSKEVRTKIFLKDLTNQRFGDLLVLERDRNCSTGKGKFARWICKCNCGNIVSVRGDHLRDGGTQSCGCLNSIGEKTITEILIKNNVKYKTQYEFDNLKGDYNKLRFDFAIFNDDNKIKCLIEYQGEQHYKKWGNESDERFLKRQQYDQLKRDYCNKNNLKLIEIPYFDFKNLSYEYLINKM